MTKAHRQEPLTASLKYAPGTKRFAAPEFVLRAGLKEGPMLQIPGISSGILSYLLPSWNHQGILAKISDRLEATGLMHR